MSKTIHEQPDFCLPAEFLTDEDLLMHNKQSFLENKPPNNFEEQLVELTRQLTLQKSYPKNHYGCYSPRSPGSSSDGSPTSHFTPTRNSLDLIYQAAAQVSNLKINAVNVPLENSSALYNSFVEKVRGEHLQRNVWSNNQLKNGPIFQPPQSNRFSGVNVGGYLLNDQPACPSLQYVMQQNLQKKSSVFPNGGSGKPSAGTGVFLPRRYESNCGGIRTKTNRFIGYSTGGRITTAASGGGCVRSQWKPIRGDELCFDYGIQLAQKNATMLMHQRRHRLHQEVGLGHELGLPQEWTY